MTDVIPETTTAEPETDEAASAALWAEMAAAVKGEKTAPEANPAAEPTTGAARAPEDPAKPVDTHEGDDDLWAGASEAQRKAFEDLQHRARSDQERVGALQKQLNALQQQIAAAQTAKPAEPSKAAVDWAVFEKDYPDEAKAFKALQAESEAKIQALQHKLDSLSGASDGQFFDLLDAVRPDWRETVNAPEFDRWLSAQDEPTQAKLQSSKVGDAVGLLRAYDAHRDATRVKADKIRQDRDARAKNAESVAGRSAAPPLDDEPADSAALWREATAHARKRRGL